MNNFNYHLSYDNKTKIVEMFEGSAGYLPTLEEIKITIEGLQNYLNSGVTEKEIEKHNFIKYTDFALYHIVGSKKNTRYFYWEQFDLENKTEEQQQWAREVMGEELWKDFENYKVYKRKKDKRIEKKLLKEKNNE